ncbi:MAG: DUF58 domain-containing protein [Lentisphaerales bacterium]|nr:DUF58 domain-containing protein [Lentisphaerales bacterium]
MPEVDLGKYLNPAVVNAIERLDLQAKCIVEGFIAGRHRSPYHGFSSTFSEHRRYNSGDPIKDIDWNVYAKTEKHFVKKYEAETDLQCHMIMDISSSMGYKHEDSEVSKLDYGIFIAAAISYMITKQQDSIGLITFDNELCHYIRPKSKMTHLAKLITILSQIKTCRETSFSSSLPNTLKLMKQKGLVVFISDMLGDSEAALQTLQMLRCKKHDVIVFQILDEAELKLPFKEMSHFIDTENNDLQVKAKAEEISQAYQDEIETFTNGIKTECEKIGASYLLLSTSDSFDKALSEFLLKRRSCF